MTTTAVGMIEIVERIGREVARPDAARVDKLGVFPSPALDALRAAGVFGAGVPAEFGGGGADVDELLSMCVTLARHCASSAMILAMHHIQVVSIARHLGGAPELEAYLRRVVVERRLIASVTSEVGPAGDMRRSIAAVRRTGERFEVTKRATTISYGAHADDLLLTARRDADSAPGDQVAVLLLRPDFEIREPGVWDTLGMRGTCSGGGVVTGSGSAWQILRVPFGVVASETMVPVSHILWAGCWLGIASDAVDRARTTVRAKARKDPDEAQAAATELSDVEARLQAMRDVVRSASLEFERLADDRAALSSISFGLRMNHLKLIASEAVVDVVTSALRICGISAYANDPRTSLGRHLRDAHSAALMVNNRRLRSTNASLLLVHKADAPDHPGRS